MRGLLFFIPVILLGLAVYKMVSHAPDNRRIAGIVTGVILAIVWHVVVSGIRE